MSFTYPQTAIDTQIGVDWETAEQGVIKTSSQKLRKIACMETISKTKPPEEVDEVRSDPNPQDPIPGPTDVNGDINLAPNLTQLPFWLSWFCNDLPTPSGADPYLYDGVFAGGQLKTIMLEKGYLALGAGAQYEVYRGLAAKSLSSDFAASGLLKFRMGAVGMDADPLSGTPYDATADDWETGAKLHHAMIAPSGMLVNDTPVDYFLTGSWSMERTIDLTDRPVGAAGVLASLAGSKIKCSGSATFRFGRTSVLTTLRSGNPIKVELIYTASAAPSHYLSLKWGRLFPDYTSPKKSKDGLLELTANWTAAFDNSDASAFRWKVQNDKAATEYA